MTVTADVANLLFTTGAAATSLSNSASCTVAAGDNGLLAFMGWEGNPGAVSAAPSWSGVGSTQVGSTTSNGTVFAAAYGLLAPAVGVHLTFAAAWTNSVPFVWGFVPLKGVTQASVAAAFTNFVNNTATASTTISATITDGSSRPANNLDLAFVGDTGQAISLTTGQTDVGNKTTTVNDWDMSYGVGSASQAFGYSATIGATWAEIGLTVVGDTFALSGSPRIFMRDWPARLFQPVRKFLRPRKLILPDEPEFAF